MKNETQLRNDIVEVGRRLWVRGFVASNDGNISVRLDDKRLLMTPASVSKGFMTPDMMVITDLDGKLLEGAPGRKPSSETQMHLVVYRNRPDVEAVVHSHPPLSTGFAVAGIPLDRAVLAEVVTTPSRAARRGIHRGICRNRNAALLHRVVRRSQSFPPRTSRTAGREPVWLQFFQKSHRDPRDLRVSRLNHRHSVAAFACRQ